MDRLRKRTDFLAVAKGRRAERIGFLIQARGRRSAEGSAPSDMPARLPARLGFTVTKKIGNAVVRNRIRRRLREAVRQLDPDRALADTDYVLMAREKSLRLPFARLTAELNEGMAEINRILMRQPNMPQPKMPQVKPGANKAGRPEIGGPAKRTAEELDGQ